MRYGIKSKVGNYIGKPGLIYEQKLREFDGQVILKNKVVTSNKKDTIDAINSVVDKIGLNVHVESKESWEEKVKAIIKKSKEEQKEKAKAYFGKS